MNGNLITDDLARLIPKRLHVENPSTLPEAWRTFFRYSSPRIVT